MIDVRVVIEAHSILIDQFGGCKGVRNQEGLEAAIARPFMTFDSVELYPEPADKAAAIFESLIINHPFIDGNKRIAYLMLRLFLLESGTDIVASEDDKYNMTVASSIGELKINDIRDWIILHLK